jgi:S1-C subfamily serine protease
MTVLAMLVSFLLGIGSFAVGGQLISSLSQTERPSVTQPEQPVQPNQQPNQRSDDNYRNADTSVTAEQSKGIVLIWGISGNSQSAGTGMVLDAAGKILTNYHVVAGTESLTATIVDTGKTYSATVVGFDAQRDVALLQLDDANGLQTVTLDYDTLHNGDAVSVVGNAEGGGVLIRANGQVLGMDQSLTVSSDSPWGAEENLEGLIASNANAVPGDSGGPMFDSQAQVTGMTTAGSQKESMSFAIPIADAMAIVRVIEAGHDEGSVRVGPAGYIGITVVPERGHRLGRQIQEIAKDSPADQAGIAPGSTLTQVDSTEVRGDTNLANVIRALEPGTVVQVTWIDPSGVEHSAAVTLGSSPVN